MKPSVSVPIICLCLLVTVTTLAQGLMSSACRHCIATGSVPSCNHCFFKRPAVSFVPFYGRRKRDAQKHQAAIFTSGVPAKYQDSVLSATELYSMLREAASLTCKCCEMTRDAQCCGLCDLSLTTSFSPGTEGAEHTDSRHQVNAPERESNNVDVLPCETCCHQETFDVECCLACDRK